MYLVFKTRYVDTENHCGKVLFSSQEQRFFLCWIRGMRVIRRRACLITSERYIVGLSVRCLSIINRGRDLRQEAPYSGCFYGLVERGVSFGREGDGW